MTSKNTTNYKFLKDFRPELYKLAVKMEEDLLITPVSMLAYGTRFLEYILYDIAKLSNYKVNTESGFVNNIYELIQLDFLDYSLGDLLIKAYVFRNDSIHNTNIAKVLKYDRKTALELNKRLFDIADAYYKTVTNNYEGHLYVEPKFIEKTEGKLTTVEKQEKVFDTCIICGEHNKISKSNFCQDCDNLINYRDVLANLIAKKGKNSILKANDFTYPFKNQLIKDLLAKNILEQVGNDYNFVNDNLDNYFKLIDEFVNIDKFLTDFVNGNASNYKNSKFYTSDEYPYRQVSKLIDDYHVWQVVKLLENGFSLEYSLGEIDINKSILDNWYNDKKSEFVDGNKEGLFVRYNEFLIKELFKSIEKNNLCNVDDSSVDFWSEYFEGFSKNLSNRLAKQKLIAFVELFKNYNTKKEALNEVGLSDDEFNKLIKIHKKISEEYFEEVGKRKDLVLIYLKKSSLKDALEKSKLDMTYLNDEEFYQKITEILQKRYLDLRKQGLSTEEICKKLTIDKSEVQSWRDNKIFKINYQNVRLNLFKNAVANEKSKSNILKDLEITQQELNEYISLGKSGNKLYFEYCDYFENRYYQDKFNIFINEFKRKSNFNLALKEAGLTNDEFNEFMKYNENYKEFSDLKLDVVSDYLIKKGKINPKFLKKMGMTKNDYRDLEVSINKLVIEKQVDLITEATINDEIIYFAAKEVHCNWRDAFEWIYEGTCGDEKFEKLADEYWPQVLSYINRGNSLLRRGDSIGLLKQTIDPKLLGKYDLEYWVKWGLIDKRHIKLTLEDIKNIIRDVKRDI